MNLFDSLRNLFISTQHQIVKRIHPTDYIPLKEAVEETALERATREFMDAEKELKESSIENEIAYQQLFANHLKEDAAAKAKRNAIEDRHSIAEVNYQRAKDKYDAFKKTNTDLLDALRELAHAENDLQNIQFEFKQFSENSQELNIDQVESMYQMLVRMGHAKVRYVEAKAVVDFINSSPQTAEAKNVNLAYNKLTNAESEIRNTSLSTELEPSIASEQKIQDPKLAEIDSLALSLESALDKYSKAKTALALAAQQSTAGLQLNAASRSRITPLEAVFQLVQYGKDLLSDALIQQLIIDSLTTFTAAAIVGKLGMFSSAACDALEAPDYTNTNRVSYNF